MIYEKKWSWYQLNAETLIFQNGFLDFIPGTLSKLNANQSSILFNLSVLRNTPFLYYQLPPMF